MKLGELLKMCCIKTQIKSKHLFTYQSCITYLLYS